MPESRWQPSASLEQLQARAALLAQLRAFFAARDVMEVETPLLSRSTGTDINLGSLEASYQSVEHGEKERLYLQTSPEFAMKRLLAAGSGSIYQICKAFRNGETGGRHNPEFTMLEWYRTGFDDKRLMDEVEDLLRDVLGCGPVRRASYQSLFEEHVGVNPHLITARELALRAKRLVNADLGQARRDIWLDLLFSHVVEPALKGPVFIHDFPASQAALARVTENPEGIPVARRFELMVGGLEIANGYLELTDVGEQAARFRRDLEMRRESGLLEYPVDNHLLSALAAGLPECAGVALGVDRLLMLKTGAKSIQDVLAFPLLPL